jgi:hypothetical protein
MPAVSALRNPWLEVTESVVNLWKTNFRYRHGHEWAAAAVGFKGQVLGKASTFVAAMMAAWIAAPAAAGTMQVVSAGDEYEQFHPKAPAAAPRGNFHATMDQVFGAGRWRQTSGYRTRAQEDALRRQGAGTVAAGHTSLHSIGGPDGPAAYDAVVDHMSPASAAAKLKRAGGAFSRVLAERAHGAQGPHLHVELVSNPPRAEN